MVAFNSNQERDYVQFALDQKSGRGQACNMSRASGKAVAVAGGISRVRDEQEKEIKPAEHQETKIGNREFFAREQNHFSTATRERPFPLSILS
jgi:hypothetical protein